MEDRMTLIERLRNPTWKSSAGGVVLATFATRKDMEEAADILEKVVALALAVQVS